jgi:UDP-2,3-diacylglucosamine pyrophosphatase LpxH
VCGHIHHPESTFEKGIHYINDGDWIENCSALSEDMKGNLSIIHYLDSLESATVTSITTKTSRSKAA